MIEAYSVADVRSVEDHARADLPEGRLMKRAARGLADVVLARLEELGVEGGRVVALVGRGDNGGDALYAVARLARRGVTAAAVTLGREDDAAVAAARKAGAVVASYGAEVDADDDPHWRGLLGEADLVLDGLLGIGGRPGLGPDAAALVDAVPDDAWVVAVDLPSGADPAGEVAPHERADLVVADETVTFSLLKPVHLLPATEPVVGRLTVVEIGIGASLESVGPAPVVERLTFDDVAALWPRPGADSDKYSRGVIGVVAGSVRYPGAAVLSVLGALGAGPGMVRYHGPEDVQWLVHQSAPEVVTSGGRVQAWLLGSGFDVDGDGADAHEQRHRAHEALDSGLPVVVDAGALDLVDRRGTPTLLTPHAGELARLLTRLEVRVDAPDGSDGAQDGEVTREQVTRAPLAHARAAAARTGATVLLKGSTTLVVSPDPLVAVRSQHDAPAWLATAGAGDVLGGILGTLLAAGLDPRDAGALGALVHGVAADRASAGGPLRIRDVAHEVGPAVRALLTR